MTIRVINPPSASESYYYSHSNVKAVDQFNVYFHDGSSSPKKLCAKVEIISLLDRPDDVETDDFYTSIGCTKFNKILEREVGDISGYKKMSMAQFEALDILTHL